MKFIIIGLFLLVIVTLYYSVVYPLTHTCIKSHEEVQYHMPLGIVVGGSKYGGGVSIPLGNARPVTVRVCEEYK